MGILFKYIEPEYREKDGNDYVFEDTDGSKWVGLSNGCDGVESYDDAADQLYGEYLPWRAGEYPRRKPIIIDPNLPPKPITIRYVEVKKDINDLLNFTRR